MSHGLSCWVHDIFCASPDCESGSTAACCDGTSQLPRRLHPIVADAPLGSVGIAEQARGREKEPAPAPHPLGGLLAMDVAQGRLDQTAMRVEIGEPVVGGALIMRAAPAPLLLDHEDIVELPDEVMARHQPAREDVLRDPVFAIGPVE